MKLKFLAILAIAGMAIVGCGSNKSNDENADSASVDTTINPGVDTTMTTDTAATDTSMNKPVDSTRQ